MLNPNSPLPLYHQLAEELADQIRAGTFTPGQRLPSEPELAKRHGIGRPTVRQATDILVQRRLVERRRGAGTFVRPVGERVDLFSLCGTLHSFRSSGLSLETQLLEPVALRQVPADASEDNPFIGRQAYTLVRLGVVESTPVLVEHVYLEHTVFRDLDRVSLGGASLAEIVRERYGLEPTSGEQTFTVAVGSPQTQAALRRSATQPVLLIRRTLNFPSAVHAVYSELFCRTDKITFTQQLGDPQP